MGTLVHVLLPFLGDLFLKSALILSAALLFVTLFFRFGAVWRHRIWALAFGALLVTVGWLLINGSASEKIMQTVLIRADAETSPPINKPEAVEVRAGTFMAQNLTPLEKTSEMPWWMIGVVGIWLGGLGYQLGLMARQSFRLSQYHRRAERVTDGTLLELATLLCIQLKIQRTVRFVHHPDAVSPMTWGIFRPVVLLPSDWLVRPDDEHEIALMHELVHVRRWDYATHMVALWASAWLWFNPMVWMARRQMLIERERACDAAVLQNGVLPSSYASQLVRLAQQMKTRLSPNFGLGMAHSSDLKSRVEAILHESDDRLNRFMWGSVLSTMLVFVLMFMPMNLQWKGKFQTLPDWVQQYRTMWGTPKDAWQAFLRPMPSEIKVMMRQKREPMPKPLFWMDRDGKRKEPPAKPEMFNGVITPESRASAEAVCSGWLAQFRADQNLLREQQMKLTQVQQRIFSRREADGRTLPQDWYRMQQEEVQQIFDWITGHFSAIQVLMQDVENIRMQYRKNGRIQENWNQSVSERHRVLGDAIWQTSGRIARLSFRANPDPRALLR